LLYFIVHSDTLSVFKKSSENDSVHLELKVKFHHNLISIDNNSKLLSSVIAQALDELGEKIDLENQQAAIAIDDSVLSHSLNVISKKDQLALASKVKEELQDKWKDLFRNYFSVSESKKSSKNIFHTVGMNHYLREKIKLNFNNFGIDIKYLVPVSSILLSGIKSTQYAVTKSSRIYSIFNYSKKGFSFSQVSFTGKKKGFKRILGLADMVKIKEKDLKNPNLRYILFNDMKVVEFFAKTIKDSSPILNFIKPFGVQIVENEHNKKVKAILDKSNHSALFRYLQSFVAGLLTLGLIVLTLVSISDFDFLYNESSEDVEKVINKKTNISISQIEEYRTSSYMAINEFSEISISNNIDKIQSINILDNRINIDTNSNDGIGGGYTIKSSAYPSIDKSIKIDNLLSLISNIDNNIQFQRTDGLFFNIASDNIIIRCEGINSSIQILDNIKQYNNLILRKIQYTKTDSSVHLYITALRS
jgi:hypothetical protein